MTAQAQVRLNRYERGIVDSLEEEFGYTPDAARRLVVRYVGVVRKLGGYDNARDHAERLHLAGEAGCSPESWLEKIRVRELESKLAGGISALEGPYAQVR